MQITLVALHGFWGQSSDWAFLSTLCKSKRWNLIAPDLHQSSTSKSLSDWASDFNLSCSRLKGPQSSHFFLIGYSMGGRLALHALTSKPQIWSGAILISTHTGLTNAVARKQRLKADSLWKKRFESKEKLSSILDDWNKQPIFNTTKSPRKKLQTSKKFRSSLAHVMDSWSLGKQKNLLPKLRKVTCPVLMIAGEKDTKFTQIAKSLPHHLILQNCGHRVSYDQPLALTKAIGEFILQQTDQLTTEESGLST